MSHLGDQLSALIDGELDGAELDRAHAHLASCERCRADAADLREQKQKQRALASGVPTEPEMTRRLIAITGPGGPLPPRQRRMRLAPGPRPPAGPGSHWPGPRRRVRRRYLMLGTASLVVGLGIAAFTIGGGGAAAPGPRITPPVEMYVVEHAITTGEIPFAGPSVKPSPGAPASDPDAPPP
jgi:anti-sigma factor RsiW